MEFFDLALAYVWEYDYDFVAQIEKTCQQEGLTTYIISDYNIDEVYEQVKKKKLRFRFLLDRAWDVDERFGKLGNLLAAQRTVIFNKYENVTHSIDKATMHLEFLTAGLNVPFSIIIPPHTKREELYISVNDLAILGRPFIIKPCNNTGGGIGVVTGAETLEEVFEQRLVNEEDKYLLQEKIYPKIFGDRRAWFRCFWAFGEVIPVWWNDQTHVYKNLTEEEILNLKLKPLLVLTKKIAKLTGLDFFSTEIVLSAKEKFVVIDYVNDQCDMRFKSLHHDGVPDEITLRICENLKLFILKRIRKF